MSSVSFDEYTFPLYYAYGNETVSQGTIAGGRCAHTQIYLLGTSKNAHVLVSGSGGTTATYTPMEGFGIIDVYIELDISKLEGEIYLDEKGQEKKMTYRIEGEFSSSKDYDNKSFSNLKSGDIFFPNSNYKIISYHVGEAEYMQETKTLKKKVTGTVIRSWLIGVEVYVEVDGLTYQMYVSPADLGVYDPSMEIPSKFYIDDDAINADKYDTQLAQSGQVQRAGSNSSFKSSSDSFIPGDWVDKMKDKVIDAVEDKAIDVALGLLFKLIFF